MSIAETNRPTARIRTATQKRQKTPVLYIDLELNGIRVDSFEAVSPITVARAKVGEREPRFVGTTLRLPSRCVSRARHCTIEPSSEGQVVVIDHDSTNGTAVNGRPVRRQLTVAAPCTVEIAPYELVVSRTRERYETAALRARPLISDADLQVDPRSGAIRLRDGSIVHGLSPLQHAIAATLIDRYPRPVASSELLSAVNPGGSIQGLYTQINELRDRLEAIAPGGRELIWNRRSFGYSITPLPEA